MKEAIDQWFKQNSRTPGLLAWGVSFPDQPSLNQSYSDSFPASRLEEAWQHLAETVSTLTQHRITTTRLRWSYDDSKLYFAVRTDGICLGLFTPAELDPPRHAQIDHLLSEFLELESDA